MVEKHQWHSVTLRFDADKSFIVADAMASGEALWFDGHFPGKPILPGIAMISMAFDAAREKEVAIGNHIRLKSVSRVRFKKPVQPDETLKILLTREQHADEIHFRFTIQVNDGAVCTGILHTVQLTA